MIIRNRLLQGVPVRKYPFVVILLFLLCILGSCSQAPTDCPACPPALDPEVVIKEVTVEVPATCPEMECPTLQCPECPSIPSELGPWTIQQSIDTPGQYLVPEEMLPGQWAYQADDPSDTCWATTYSDLSGSMDSRLEHFYSENKGFFVLTENVRMVQLETFGPCTFGD
jgi:hypothetical protein